MTDNYSNRSHTILFIDSAMRCTYFSRTRRNKVAAAAVPKCTATIALRAEEKLPLIRHFSDALPLLLLLRGFCKWTKKRKRWSLLCISKVHLNSVDNVMVDK